MVHLINIILGTLFLSVFSGKEYFFLNLFVSIIVYEIFKQNVFNFSKLMFLLLKYIPKTLYESILVFFIKNEKIEFEEYKDDFEMLVKILYITLTPKTIAFDHDDRFLYIHKLGD
ncbi:MULTISPECIES: hypothetical protein [unclassified Thermosipho (in: thermotogales)]|uniref:hypothetical protein n=1 Tax=unclassified Thermosipho (in: thermotogales) TaxID=2676525 RepID=UPI000985768A|nr:MULTISPECIES: hypothetical protein [unclassified Thermosipho (in: thermotogales)]MBT1248312.1 hypothetical protein [Thermosipho sp. 1244]OOC47449.1 hypothetical protein XO09_00375 [Thermosipho sp. 1223]